MKEMIIKISTHLSLTAFFTLMGTTITHVLGQTIYTGRAENYVF